MTRYKLEKIPCLYRTDEVFVLFYRPSMEMKRNLAEVSILLPDFQWLLNLVIRENYT